MLESPVVRPVRPFRRRGGRRVVYDALCRLLKSARDFPNELTVDEKGLYIAK